MVNSTYECTFAFDDRDERKVSIGNFPNADAQAIADFKQRVKDFNASDTAAVASYFLSDNGASCTGIVNAAVTLTEKTVIYAKDAAASLAALSEGGTGND